MKIKVFYPNEKGNIELTKEKLEAILTEAYNGGYRDGNRNNGYYYSGITTTTPYVTGSDNITCLGPTDNNYTLTADIAKISTLDCSSDTATNVLEAKAACQKNVLIEYVEG